MTDKDLKDCKMEWFEIEEQNIRDNFHTIKETFKDVSIIFLSERYFKLYTTLKEKYKEIELPKVILNKEPLSILKRSSSLYLNDIPYERMPTHFYKDYLTYLSFDAEVFANFPDQFRKHLKRKYLFLVNQRLLNLLRN